MNTQTTDSKYKVLVLMDKTEAANNALKNSINLAKLVDASVEVFQVEKPTSVVNNPNQIAALREIDEQRSKQTKKLQQLISTISNEEHIPVSFNFTIGNVKNEIEKHIEKTKPDIVVLGKRKKKIFSFLGDKVTRQVLENYTGGVMISSSTDAFTSYNNKSIGFLNDTDGLDNVTLTNDLRKLTNKPLKIFKTAQKETNNVTKNLIKNDAIVYEFDSNNNSADDMTNFISKNDLSFLCVTNKRENKRSLLNTLNKTLTKTLENTNVPILILNQN